ncbi:Uncharacterised protein [Serratia quinivorans]|uniref:Uncharacterized protein n=1 Tax=Serratia quinivorans TaxID=137545 RepID=A0A379YEG2_9GAMM|nr:Uncharacterised protein [Serratia quinivorans]
MVNAQVFDIDVSAMESLKQALNATQAQYVGAYNRALTRTVSKLYRDSVMLMMEQAGVRKKSIARRRVRQFKKTTQRRPGGAQPFWSADPGGKNLVRAEPVPTP